ncbi:MAG TPA: hypothetical protein VLV15_16680 [Dongiaceae bacterium]|nr:hypothetical protein [Dongiaceae bacterium]
MTCLEFERLLDGGKPERLPAAALAHARECARCERALARARSLESALERHFASALELDESVPESFADHVMLRVERVEARGVRWLTLPDPLPWWVRVPAEPTVALAAAATALLLWRGDQMIAATRAWAPGLSAATGRATELANTTGIGAVLHALASAFVPAPGASWSVVTAMAIGVAPLLALAGYGMWRLGERLVGRPVVALEQ